MAFLAISDQYATFFLLNLFDIFFFFFRYSTGPYEGIAYCVCVAECVDNSREQVHIFTLVAIYRVLEWSQHRTRSWESRSLKVSMLSASVTSFGRAFHWRVPSGKNPRWYAKVRVYGTRNWALPVLLLAGGCVMWSDARMSTRPWTILYILDGTTMSIIKLVRDIWMSNLVMHMSSLKNVV